MLEQLKSFSLSPPTSCCVSLFLFGFLFVFWIRASEFNWKPSATHLNQGVSICVWEIPYQTQKQWGNIGKYLGEKCIKTYFPRSLDVLNVCELGTERPPLTSPFSSQVSQMGLEPGPESWLRATSATWRPSHLSGAALSSSSFIISQMSHNQYCLLIPSWVKSQKAHEVSLLCSTILIK